MTRSRQQALSIARLWRRMCGLMTWVACGPASTRLWLMFVATSNSSLRAKASLIHPLGCVSLPKSERPRRFTLGPAWAGDRHRTKLLHPVYRRFTGGLQAVCRRFAGGLQAVCRRFAVSVGGRECFTIALGVCWIRFRVVIKRRPSIATLLAGTRRHGPPTACRVVAMGASKGQTVTLLLGLPGPKRPRERCQSAR